MTRSRWAFLLVSGLVAGLALMENAAAAEWWTVRDPSRGPAETMGSPVAGCISGAEALPLDGPGYQVVRVSRNRYYGHPRLIRFVRSFGLALERAGIGPVYVGDLSQPRGGPLTFGHASHQNGLDADIWFTLAAKPRKAPTEREDVDTPSLVAAGGLDVERGMWREDHRRMLELAARDDEVERIFVNPAIKRHLCRTVTGERSWLRRIRPWYHHDAHFHVRLRCAPEDTLCVGGPPLPPGDGCDETLDRWLAPGMRAVANQAIKVKLTIPSRPSVIRKLPDACRAVIKR
ncbi:MAG: penicillin-insensitive murein endopeptidase [Alphaproteobacteria bacterium]